MRKTLLNFFSDKFSTRDNNLRPFIVSDFIFKNFNKLIRLKWCGCIISDPHSTLVLKILIVFTFPPGLDDFS